MKPNRELLKELAQQAAAATAIHGGVAKSNFGLERTSEGLLLRLNTPSLDDSAYHIRVEKGALLLYTMFKSSMAENISDDAEDDSMVQPSFVHSYPLSPKVDQGKIEAIFDHGELRVYLPFLSDDDMDARDIDIQRYS